MKKVVMISNSFHPKVGGAERQILKLAAVLLKEGIEVEVVTRSLPECRRRESFKGIKIRRIPVCGGRVVAALFFVVGSLFYLLRKRERPFVIHAHSLASPATIAALCKVFTGTPSLVKIPGGSRELRIFSSGLLGRARLKLLSSLIDFFIPLSREVEQEMLDLSVPLQRIVTIANGVEIETLSESDPIKRDFHRHSPLAAYVGRLEWLKGVDILLEAWKTVVKKFPDALLFVVGSGSEEPELRKSASENDLARNVIFTGEVSDPDRYYRNVDMVVLPSRSEGLSNTLLEAMAMSVPVVASAVGGTTDIVTHRVNGLLFSPGNSRQLAEDLILLIEDEKLRRRIGLFGRKTVAENFEIGTVAERYMNLYRSLVRRKQVYCH